MSLSLKQTNILNIKHFTISDTGLLVKERNLFNRREYSVKFDNIGTQIIEVKTIKKWWIIGSIISLLIAIMLFISKAGGEQAEIFYLIISLICATMAILTYKKSLYLTTNENNNAIEFFLNKPTGPELKSFITNLIKHRNTNLLKHYGQIDKLLSYEQQYNRLMWLREIEALTEDEFEKKLIILKNHLNPGSQISGFR